MGLKQRLLHSALGALAFVVMPTAADCLEFIHRIDRPLPPEFRERVAAFIRKERPADFQAAIENARAWWYGSLAEDTAIIVRVEAGCPKAGNCMTVIGRMTEQRFDADLTLEVGPTFLATDISFGLWGSPSSPPLIFDAGGVGVVALFRQQSWVVSACADCTNWKDRARVYHYIPEKPKLPEPEIAKQTFDEFRRALEAHRE